MLFLFSTLCISFVSHVYLLYPHTTNHKPEAILTNVTVASPETFLALTLVLVWLSVGAGPAILTRLVSPTVVQI